MKRFLCMLLSIILCIAAAGIFTVKPLADDIEDVDAIIASIPGDWPQAPAISAKAAILMDADSGEILYAKNATKSMYPASTTKLVTALLSLEEASLQDIVSFSSAAVAIPAGSSHIAMRRGEQMVLRECLYGLLLPSANEVANALAEHISGTIKTFVVHMNERVYQLGGVNTVFTNANGLHDPDHYTCAYDLALVMQACAANNTFVEIASSGSYVHHADELLNKDIPMTNTDMMVRVSSEFYNPDVVCGKTGHTDESGYNLVTYAERDGTRLVVVVMGCENGSQYVSTTSLLDYGFNYFHKVLPSELDDSLSMNYMFTSSPLAIPTPDVSLLSMDSAETILLPDTVTFDKLEKTVTELDDGLRVTYIYQGYPLGSIKLSYTDPEDKNPMYADDAAEKPALSTPDPLITMDVRVIVYILFLLILSVVIIVSRAKWMKPVRKFRKKK